MFKHILSGMLSYVPGLTRFKCRGTGGSYSSRYCYSVWLRHLVMAYKYGLSTHPHVVAELGPGNSLGIGLSALLSGSDQYYGLDIVEHTSTERNLAVFEELIEFFSSKEPIPGHDEFPRVWPTLESYEFPHDILTDDRLQRVLSVNRVKSIRKALTNINKPQNGHVRINYIVPWYNSNVIEQESVDMLYSQAVLEHVEDLPQTYQALHRWLKVGGYMSHQIGLVSHGLSKYWNGHWAFSDLTWKLIRGNKPYFLNKEPCSTHYDLIRKNGFEIVAEVRRIDNTGLPREKLNSRFCNMSPEDAVTRGLYVLAKKK